MYLKRLELQGFKSFADKTTLDFMPGITAVIGPNGSGKSNISDSIRWVLGEQSMKSLRGSKSEDIIFAGTQNRKSLGFAEASLIFDNQDGKLPIEYKEVIVTRRIYRSGESGYYINKVPCRLKDILELFMDTGIGKDGYSIIGQGKIDEILSNKSEDRRHIFEEAAGIVKYRARKEESEKKLEHTKLNLLRINDIISEIEANIEPLKLQSEKAKKFLELREELKHIEIGLFIEQIESNKAKIENMIKDIETMNFSYEEEQGRQQSQTAKKDNLKAKMDALMEEIEKIQNIGFESSNKIEKINSEINVASQKILNHTENHTRYEKEIEELKAKIKLLEDEKKQKLAKKENLYQNKEKFEKELKEKEEEKRKLTEKLSVKQLEIEEKKQKVLDNIDKKYEIQSEIQAQELTYGNLEKREKAIQFEMQTTISELDGSRMRKSDISQEFTKIESDRNQITNSLTKIKEEKSKQNEILQGYEKKINQMKDQIRMKESRLRFLQETEKEKEGYTKSVKALLNDCEKIKELGKGMHGVLANILSVPAKYETAIEMCLGAGLQNIVTDSEEEAKRLVQHLRTHNLGRASFLPITSVKGKKLDRIDSKGISGVIGIASDLVQYQKQYDGIMQNLLGRTVIVEDMDTGIALAKKNKYAFRIVTIKGDIINASGAITGGSVVQKTVNILGRSREIEELEKEITVLKENLEKEEKNQEKYLEEIEDILEAAESLERQLQEIDVTYATEKQKLIAVEENVVKLENRFAKIKLELQEIQKQKEVSMKEKEIAEENIQELNKQTEELNRQIEEFTSLHQDDQTNLDNLNLDITNLKISVSSFEESESSIREMEEMLEQDIQNSKNSITNKEKQILQMEQEKEELEKQIVDNRKEIERIKNEVQLSGSKVEELKKNRIQTNQEINQLEEEITSQFKKLEEIKEQIVKIDAKKAKMEQEMEEMINQMWEEYEVTPNNAKEYERPQNINLAQKQVNGLKGQIRELGSINIDSIEEYKQTKERYDFMCEQRLDLENAITKLKKVIHDMTNTMQEQFKEKFKQINHNFNEVFKELFGGGKAELILTDESNILECGIDIQVQPPGKKLQNMTLLSGGEKAFTAIAILFAILKINPAPFCVLDEIEAALDDVNVYRYAEYLKKFARETQFLIITHRKGTMEAADTVYGVTMEENGISKLLSMKLK